MPTDRYPQDERLERLEKYLLGLLPEAEAEQIDELSITDEEFAWQLRAAEDDLVDAYVRDGLPLTTRARFEEYYLASPRHRERVAFAQNLALTIDRAVAMATSHVPIPTVAHETVRPVMRSRPAWWLMAAAAAVLVAFGAMVMRTGLLRPSADTPAPTVTATASGRDASTPSPVPHAPPVSTPSISAAPAAADRTRAKPAVTPDVVTLAPDTRAAGSIMTVTVPAGAERMAFDLRLETNDFPRYQATLKDPGTDRAVWQSAWTPASVKRDSPVVPVSVPARTFKPQHYTFELTGRTDANRTDLVASYVFEVIPR